MEKIIRRIDLAGIQGESARQALRSQWLLTNGLGGYASGTICGTASWRYHGYLIAALPAPLGRVVMLNHLSEFLERPHAPPLQIAGEEPHQPDGSALYCTEFRLENQLPTWRYAVEGLIIEKSVHLLQGQNTVHVTYRLIEGADTARLQVWPAIHFRGHEHPVHEGNTRNYSILIRGRDYEIQGGHPYPGLRLHLHGDTVTFMHEAELQQEFFYEKESERGFEARGALWSPGFFSVVLHGRKPVTLVASTESWDTIHALQPEEALEYYHQRHARLIALAHPHARSRPASELVVAADQFIINPVGRVQDAARAHAAGDEVRTVIAGYHWFTDWGRDTMISLEGLALCTRRYAEAGWILRMFIHHIKDGLIPNMFPEGRNEGLYHTADATLWFVHALSRYVAITGDRATLDLAMPKLEEIFRKHFQGTRFGIRMDPEDGLLCQGEEGYQLTWMDAKVEGWVVTPRRGKAVEINALWYNALRLMEAWMLDFHSADQARPYGEAAERVKASFNRRFWYAEGGYLYDVVDGEKGDDSSCRPNQLLAISLPHAVLDQARWRAVLEVVREKLLTPFGLRTLTQNHPDYKSKYFGNLRARDAAYHQGTVWGWLIGPFIDAWLRVYPNDRAGARRMLELMIPHLDAACVGSISEIFDAEPPFTPRGCIAQAWSVAEVLRCWIRTAEE